MTTIPFAVSWLVEDTSPSAVARTVMSHADALSSRGHQVRIVTSGTPPRWRASRAEWIEVGAFDDYVPGPGEIVIATTWNSVASALRLGGSRAVHLCVVDEPALAETDSERSAIEDAWSQPIRKVAASGAARNAALRFGAARSVPLMVDEEFFDAPRRSDRLAPRVLLYGHASVAAHGLEYGYGAAAHARWFHQRFELVRISRWVPSREEPLDSVDEFHVSLSSAELVRLLSTCDILIAPAMRERGFALTAAEAMAAGLAVVGSQRAPDGDGVASPVRLAPEGNAVALGEQLMELLEDAEQLAAASQTAREYAQRWRTGRVVPILEEALSADV